MRCRLDKRLRPLCVRALKRVFLMCDSDGDGALSDTELNQFQVRCWGLPGACRCAVGPARVLLRPAGYVLCSKSCLGRAGLPAAWGYF